MQPEYHSFGKLSQGLALLSQKRVTGELILTSVDDQWHLYLFLGRLLFATGGCHRVRRWQRAVTQDCCNLQNYVPDLKENELWEYYLLKQAVNENKLTLTQVKSIIGKIVNEALFALVNHKHLHSHWLPKKLYPIALLELEQSLHGAAKLREEWKNRGLGQISPDTAPIFKKPISEQNIGSSYVLPGMFQLVNGENTIWDIALRLRQNLTDMASALQRLSNMGILEFSTVPDLPTPGGVSVSLPLTLTSAEPSIVSTDHKMLTQSSQGLPKDNTTQISTINELTNEIGFCHKTQFTGQLQIEDSQAKQWGLYFHLGDLIGCSTSVHPIRRWCRQLSQHCPQLTEADILEDVMLIAKFPISTPVGPGLNLAQSWDKGLLAELLRHRKVLDEQVAVLIPELIQETLFDICQLSHQILQHSELQLTYTRVPIDATALKDSVLISISPFHVWQQALEAWQAWQRSGLVECSPNQAPIIWQGEELRRLASPVSYQKITSLADGNKTLRDLAVKLKQDVLLVLQSIQPYISQGLMGLVEVGDYIVSAPNTHLSKILATSENTALYSHAGNAYTRERSHSHQVPAFVVQSQATRPLIAYIDDSQSDSLKMSNILTLAGYGFVNVQDAVTALPMLLEHKPNLIFLDLVMPIANGYEICVQIRRVSLFKDTPVIIVTSHDGIVDRVRARIVNASGFLAKPITSEKVLRILQRYLPSLVPVGLNKLQTAQA